MQGEDVKTTSQVCTDCGSQAPPTETNYTLISARYGWRLSLEKRPDGRRVSVWRCPSCWERHRGRQQYT